MTTEKLEKPQWQAYFDNVSKMIAGSRVQIDVTGLQVGDQVEAQQLPLTGLSYDSKDDCIEIITESLDHRIQKPVTIHVDYAVDGLHSIEVIDAADLHQIVRFIQPVALPEPGKVA
ncbi:MAG: DUF5335 domain-containing protein [Gammaproteobacteria bacterium]|nr:DUF5335 domain-containing protein [Gammaproteobacteria bacterium]